MKSPLMICAVFALILSNPAKTEDTAKIEPTKIEPKCLQSFKVTTGSGVSIDQVSMSCTNLEEIRAKVYNSYNIYLVLAQNQANDVVRNYIIDDIARMEKELEAASMINDNIGLIKTIIGDYGATIGLSTCLGTGGACVLESISFLYSKYKVIETSQELVKKKQSIEDLQNHLTQAKIALSNTENYSKLSSEIADKFNSLCDLVIKECQPPPPSSSSSLAPPTDLHSLEPSGIRSSSPEKAMTIPETVPEWIHNN